MPFQAVAGGPVPARKKKKKKVHARSCREILARFGKNTQPSRKRNKLKSNAVIQLHPVFSS